MVTSQYTFAFLDKMPHDLRDEFMNEFARRFEEIKIKKYDKQNDYKLHDDKRNIVIDDIPFYYTELVAYAQKCL